jgi:hypothetical protein
MPERYPGYDVLAKRFTPSWNRQTRAVIERRKAVQQEPRFLPAEEFSILRAIAERIVPQPKSREPIPVAALVDDRLFRGETDGYRNAGLPPEREAWLRGLKAFEAEARRAHGNGFVPLAEYSRDALLEQAQAGSLGDPAWGAMRCDLFFRDRLLPDIVKAYYSHPTAWSEIGFGGPASPRGYVRMGWNRRDPWEAAEAHRGEEAAALRSNRRVG